MARRAPRGGGRTARGLSKWQRAALDRAAAERDDGAGDARGAGGWAGVGGETVEHHRDGTWHVRRLPGGDKPYTCPGCGHQVAAGAPHVVAWPAERPLLAPDAPSARRHWHTVCWQQRARAGR
ncbi:hypothetical protein [Aquipuribacter nitratireducens]|uniref:ATP/GTP-binding protein n=1 Tax=Aquipuribacter nitratireducens TaxID=650104 RepID=A0ABW0GKW9_9MICO